MIGTWLASLFNTKAINQKLIQTVQEMKHNERDHGYSYGDSPNLANLRLVRRVLDGSVSYDRAIRQGMNLDHATSYLRKDKILNPFECAVLRCMTYTKRFSGRPIFKPSL